MKKIFSILIVCLSMSAIIMAQQVPQGMKYQAVARDLKGEILANKPVSLRLSLTSLKNGVMISHYSEFHEVVSSEVGLFNLVVGEGKSDGKMENVPWSNENIWMEVAIFDKSAGGYTVISQSKLMSVPYAFHANTASRVLNGAGLVAKPPGNDSPSPTSGNSWNTQGNLATNPPTDYIGTADAKDLVFKTNGVERLKITSDGQIITPPGVGLTLGGNLRVQGERTDIDFDLYVGRNVYLNTSGPGTGATINNGNFTVANNKATTLTGTLAVGGNVSVNTNKFIINALTGNTTIAGTLGIGATNGSTTKDNGALVVEGGVGIEENLNVGGSASIGGNTNFGGIVSITNATQSTATTNGALVVTGGAGIGKNLRVGENFYAPKFYDANDNNYYLDPNSFSNLSTLKVNSYAGIGQTSANVALNINTDKDFPFYSTVSGTQNVFYQHKDGPLYLRSTNPGDQLTIASYAMWLDAQDQGLLIRLNGATHPNTLNNYLTFVGKDLNVWGRIEGANAFTTDLESYASTFINGLKKSFTDAFDTPDATSAGASAPADAATIFTSNAAIESYERLIDFLASVFRFATNVVGASGLCVSGDCDDVVWSLVDMGLDLGKLGAFIWINNAFQGVSYESGGADYAEWLKKIDPAEILSFGDVVGVKGGLISKDLKDADKFMVVSFAPAVIGGMPQISAENAYEKIAFMGQVMVKVMGVVHKGDYILPSGNGDGFAIAVSPEKMLALDYKRIIGVSWEESDGKELFKYVNTAVGINSNDMAGVIDNMQTVMNRMQEAIKKISPDFVPSYYSVNNSVVQNKNGYSTMPTLGDQIKEKIRSKDADQDLTSRLQQANSVLIDQGIDFSSYNLISKCLNNPTKENGEALAEKASQLIDQYKKMFEESKNKKSSNQTKMKG